MNDNDDPKPNATGHAFIAPSSNRRKELASDIVGVLQMWGLTRHDAVKILTIALNSTRNHSDFTWLATNQMVNAGGTLQSEYQP